MILLTIYGTGVTLNILFFTLYCADSSIEDPVEETVNIAKISFLWPIFWLGALTAWVKDII